MMACAFLLPGQRETSWYTMVDSPPRKGDSIETVEGGFIVSSVEWYIGPTQRNSVYRSVDECRVVLRHL